MHNKMDGHLEKSRLFQNRKYAEKAIKQFLKNPIVYFACSRVYPIDKSNPLVKLKHEGDRSPYYICAYCDCEWFKAVNIKDTRIEYFAQEPIYKTPPNGAKDLKILVESGIYGWEAIIGPHDVVCVKCGVFIEHREFDWVR